MKSALIVLLLALVHSQAFTIRHGDHPLKYRCQLQARVTSGAESIGDGTDDTITTTGRRALLNSMIGSTALGALSLIPSNANAAGAESFVGKYSDPINHPGGTRDIKLVDGAKVGDYQLAEVFGGGGRGEPKEYVLPAVVVGDKAIIIDFSPKGGPRDFSGVLEKDGSIKFLRDGNRWPRLE